MDTVKQLQNLLNAAKESLEALGVTKIWYELDGGWCDDHHIIIQTIHDVEEEVIKYTLDVTGDLIETGKTKMVCLKPDVEQAVKNAFSSIEQELFDNRTTFFYVSPSFWRTGGTALIYSTSAIIEEKEKKIVGLQRKIDAIREEIKILNGVETKPLANKLEKR